MSEADVRLLIDCVMLVFLRDGVDRDELPPDRLAMLEERAGLSAATNRGDAVMRRERNETRSIGNQLVSIQDFSKRHDAITSLKWSRN